MWEQEQNVGKQADSIEHAVEKEKEPAKESKEPDDIGAKDVSNPIKMCKWQEKHKRHCNEIEEFGNGKKKSCTSLWGQCTETMKNESQAIDKFEEMDDNQDPTVLMKASRKQPMISETKNVHLEACGVHKGNCVIVFRKKMKMSKNVMMDLKTMWK